MLTPLERSQKHTHNNRNVLPVHLKFALKPPDPLKFACFTDNFVSYFQIIDKLMLLPLFSTINKAIYSSGNSKFNYM